MALNLHHLRLFTAVVDNAGFTRAAKALRLSQPAISKSINELERQLHVQLLDRTGKSVVLTEAGRSLHARASELFGVERVAERELRELRGLKRGVLRVGASTTIATYLLPGYLGRFHLRHPGIRIRTTSANTRAVLRALLEFRVDVALVEGPISHPRVEVIPWLDDELVVIANPHHPLIGRRVDVTMLAEQQFLVREPGSGTREVSEHALALHGVRLRNSNSMRVGGTEAIKQAVAAGLGLAIVSRAAAADQLALEKISILAVDGLVIRRTLTRLALRDRAVGGAARELIQLLGESPGGDSPSDASGDSGTTTLQG
jgi:DNA-binding transcriptional LysR family regulator